MSFFTPHDLKIRLDEESLEKVISPLKRMIDFDDLLIDIELWELLPISIGKFTAIVTAFITGDGLYTFLGGIIGLLMGGVLREMTYSNFLRRLFPMFLGSGPVTIIAAIICAIYLGMKGEYTTIIIIIAFFFPITQIESFITGLCLAPLIYMVGRHSLKKSGIPATHVERAFISHCNYKARKFNLELDWSLYSAKEAAPRVAQ